MHLIYHHRKRKESRQLMLYCKVHNKIRKHPQIHADIDKKSISPAWIHLTQPEWAMGWACVDSSSRYSSYCYRTLCCVDIYSLCGPLILRYMDVLSGSARLTGYPVLSRYFIKYGHWQRGDGHYWLWTDNIWYHLLYSRNRTSSGNIQNFTNIRKQSEKFSISGLIPNIMLTATVPHPLEQSGENF